MQNNAQEFPGSLLILPLSLSFLLSLSLSLSLTLILTPFSGMYMLVEAHYFVSTIGKDLMKAFDVMFSLLSIYLIRINRHGATGGCIGI